MPHSLMIAAIQMAAAPAPTVARLARAQTLIAQAVQAGAQLIVLPELFNTGYEYSDANYDRAEPLDGPTLTWMREAAAQHRVYLAGTLLLREARDIYNALFLIAPDGKLWRYDKIHPWAWERAYFRPGTDVTVAETPLGNFGLLICWDMAHPELWARYAGRVDAMLVCSCPPAMHKVAFELEDGTRFTADEVGPIARAMQHAGRNAFGALLRRQAAWLGVPVVNTSGAGYFASEIPLPRLSALLYGLFRPDLWGRIARSERVTVDASYLHETYIAAATGDVRARVPPGEEGFVVAQVPLLDAPPQTAGPQPAFGLSPFAYLYDHIGNLLLTPVYRRGARRHHGPQMAPVAHTTQRRWLGAALLTAAGLLVWSFIRYGRKQRGL